MNRLIPLFALMATLGLLTACQPGSPTPTAAPFKADLATVTIDDTVASASNENGWLTVSQAVGVQPVFVVTADPALGEFESMRIEIFETDAEGALVPSQSWSIDDYGMPTPALVPDKPINLSNPQGANVRKAGQQIDGRVPLTAGKTYAAKFIIRGEKAETAANVKFTVQ